MTSKLVIPFRFTALRCWVLFGYICVAGLAQSATQVPVYRWSTLAGPGINSQGSNDGPATNAQFNSPHGLAMDLGDNLYVADTNNHIIRKIAPDGTVSTLAGSPKQPGSTDGIGSNARFDSPKAVAVDVNGNVYVADTGNHTIRKITPAGQVTTLAGQAGKSGTADGAASAALFDTPDFLAVDRNGTVYLDNHGVRKISGGQVQTLQIPAQVLNVDGQLVTIGGTAGCPAVDASGQLYFWGYVPDHNAYPTGFYLDVLKLDAGGNLSVFKATYYDYTLGSGKYSIFNDASGNIFLTIDYLRIFHGGSSFGGGPLGQSDNQGMGFTNSDGTPAAPQGITVDRAGHWYSTRSADNVIIRDRSIFAGVSPGSVDNAGSAARFTGVLDMTADISGNVWISEAHSVYVPSISHPDPAASISLRKVSPTGVVTSTVVSTYTFNIDYHPSGLTADGAGHVYLALGSVIYQNTPPQSWVPLDYSYLFHGLASDRTGNLWAYFENDGKIHRQSTTTGEWSAIAGGASHTVKDGIGDQASFSELWSLKTDPQGNCLALDRLLASDNSVQSCFIRQIKPDGSVSTVSKDLLVLSGTVGTTLTKSYPGSLVVDSHGQIFLTRDFGIVLLDAAGNETPVGGKISEEGRADGIGDRARFMGPASVSIDGQDNLYVLDDWSSVVRKGEFLGYIPGITTQPQSITVTAGNRADFSVTANTTPAPAYQWNFNGNPIAGAMASTFSLSSARSADAGDYTVVVTNSLGSVTSNKATLTVSTTSTPTPTPSSTGGSGGGGAIEAWFAFALLVLGAARARK